MAIFNSYVKLPEGKWLNELWFMVDITNSYSWGESKPTFTSRLGAPSCDDVYVNVKNGWLKMNQQRFVGNIIMFNHHMGIYYDNL
jgi:hypothetical protein